MDINELLRALVEEPDQMARMTLVEENQEMIGSLSAGESTDEYKQKYEDLVKKYTETFFSQGTQTKEEGKKEENMEEEEPKSLDELGF